MRAFKYLILYVITTLLLFIVYGLVYTAMGVHDLTSALSNARIYMILIIALIFIPLLIREYKKYNIKGDKVDLKYVLIIIALSIIYNIIGYYFNKYLLHSNLYELGNIWYGIISTVLIGPIIEELLFRGIMYNELKKKYSIKKSMLITTIVFSLMHINIIQIVYTFILGYLLNRVYEKNQNIKYSIILHMLSNLTTTLVCLLIINYL